MSQPSKPKPALLAPIEHAIRMIRGERVILDADLARIYGVETKVLNQAVRRNRGKFPADFLFELTRPEAVDLQHSKKQEEAILRSQIVTLRHGHHVKHLPFAFTEHGAIMAATILKSPQAVQMSVFVVRAFVKMRAAFTDTRELAQKLAALEKELTSRLDTHETAIIGVLHRIMALLDPPAAPPEPPKPEMGFHATLKANRSSKT
jgi:hypothetical protein